MRGAKGSRGRHGGGLHTFIDLSHAEEDPIRDPCIALQPGEPIGSSCRELEPRLQHVLNKYVYAFFAVG